MSYDEPPPDFQDRGPRPPSQRPRNLEPGPPPSSGAVSSRAPGREARQDMQSPAIGALIKALAAAQAEFEGPAKDKMNPAYRHKYADLSGYLEAALPILSKHGLAVVQRPLRGDSDEVLVETVLAHTSGEWIAGQCSMIPAKPRDPHSVGSAITYARRYGLAAMIGMTAEDDDGNRGAGKDEPPQLHGQERRQPPPQGSPSVDSAFGQPPQRPNAPRAWPEEGQSAPRLPPPAPAKLVDRALALVDTMLAHKIDPLALFPTGTQPSDIPVVLRRSSAGQVNMYIQDLAGALHRAGVQAPAERPQPPPRMRPPRVPQFPPTPAPPLTQ